MRISTQLVIRDEYKPVPSGPTKNLRIVLLQVKGRMFVDCRHLPVELTEHDDYRMTHLGISQKLHAASASNSRSYLIAPLIWGSVKIGYASRIARSFWPASRS